jgi:hypothetical protein
VQHVTEFFVVSTALREMRAVGAQRADQHLAVLKFSQVELCEVAEIPMATANNWILTGALRPADVGKPQSPQALFPWQFSARLRHQASLQPRRQRPCD